MLSNRNNLTNETKHTTFQFYTTIQNKPMKKSHYLFSLGVLSLLVFIGSAFSTPEKSPAKAADEGIAFFDGSYEELIAKAAAEQKPIFIDVYTDWCGPCKMMSKYVFTQKEVGDFYNDKFICYKLNAERGEGPKIARKFAVSGYPTLLFLDKNGKRLMKKAGARSSEQFITLGNQVLTKADGATE